MGFGTIVGQVMFIIIIMIFVANALIQYNLNSTAYNEAKTANTKINSQLEKSKLEILSIDSFGSDPQSINVTVKNTGEYKLDPDLIDLYINNSKISRASVTVNIITDIINPDLIDSGETFQVINNNLGNGTHYISIVDEYSAKDSDIITIG
ncbi:hypothetical protein JXM83_03850 [Candidatus Woesearchaeota archaeon]|nr:hypothetical protein [Candidatus Woesearchaeota archaeon]